jgi:hypothetical protein
MVVSKSVLLVGLDPLVIDFTKGGYPVGMNAEKVIAGVDSSIQQLTALGYTVDFCSIDFGETAEQVLRSKLAQGTWDCIMIGAGIRLNPSNFLLFEKVVNVVHECASSSKISFNELPSDTQNAVMRWV